MLNLFIICESVATVKGGYFCELFIYAYIDVFLRDLRGKY